MVSVLRQFFSMRWVATGHTTCEGAGRVQALDILCSGMPLAHVQGRLVSLLINLCHRQGLLPSPITTLASRWAPHAVCSLQGHGESVRCMLEHNHAPCSHGAGTQQALCPECWDQGALIVQNWPQRAGLSCADWLRQSMARSA